MDSLQGDVGREEPEKPPVDSDEVPTTGVSRPASQSGLVPIETPRTPGHRPQSQHPRHPDGPVGPSSPVTDRIIEKLCLTVIHPKTRSQASDAGSGSEEMSHSTVVNEEQEIDQSSDSQSEGSDSDEQMDMNESSSPQIPPHTPRAPSRAVSTAPLSREPRDLQHPAPTPNLASYQAGSWGEMKSLVAALEVHFLRFPEFYSAEDHKVKVGELYLEATSASEWRDRRRKLTRPSWIAFCFLAEQLALTIEPDTARRLYTSTHQKPGEPVLNFALCLQEYAPHSNPAHHNRVRHFYDRLLPVLKSQAGKNWESFDDIHEIVECMVKAEQSLRWTSNRSLSCKRGWANS
ncbi:hypothetical protein N7533_007551 [Penicillium manginii]|uniref:uncharacterized protein n=1 Tax=Penicillium manginii TaxID=203109 RepID=UPI002548E7FF|nr:uncharacterized protein N7533_007551 [Penicillium manginii]KAJ5750523.1 hypothetical protein N7533_007551 [Penicillium manginii]